MAAYDWDPNLIFDAPRTNVGAVPYQYTSRKRVPGVPQLGIDRSYRDVEETRYVAPRDPRVKDLLGYSAYDKIPGVGGVPQLGIEDALDQLVPKQIEYDRPEKLGFAVDPNEPCPPVYNTELNPYDPSSRFFPHDPDYSGLMSLKQYTEDIGDVQEVPLVPSYDEYGKSKLVPKNPAYGYYAPLTRKITFNPYRHEEGDIEEMRDTLLHEGKHYFIDQYGNIVPKAEELSRAQKHEAIYFADMFRKNPNYFSRKLTLRDKNVALAFMEMHNKAKKLYQDKGDPGESKAERLIREKYGTLEQGELMEAGRKALGQTPAQVRAQERMMTYGTRGDVTAAPYSEEMQQHEAWRSGGTLNPREITKAAAREHIAKQQSEKRREQRTKSRAAQRQTRRIVPTERRGPHGGGAQKQTPSKRQQRTRSRGAPKTGPHGLQEGGLVGIDYLTRRL